MASHQTRVVAAWSVHAFTLTGIIWATLALLALIGDKPKLMWIYLGIALVVDGVDGTLARKADVQKYASRFDGVILDSIIDYLTWTFIPALFLYREGLLGEGWIGISLMLLINVSSMFCYANTAMKSEDYYFVGFPAAWNLVALALWITGMPLWANIAIVFVLVVLTWVPIAFVHPLRVRKFRALNISAAALWIITSGILVALHPVMTPVSAGALVTSILWSVAGAWLVVVGLVRPLTRERVRQGAR